MRAMAHHNADILIAASSNDRSPVKSGRRFDGAHPIFAPWDAEQHRRASRRDEACFACAGAVGYFARRRRLTCEAIANDHRIILPRAAWHLARRVAIKLRAPLEK